MSTTSLKLSDSLKEDIQRFAAEDGMSPHAFMVRTLEEAVQRANTRRTFLEAGEASLAEVLSGGAVYAAEDVHAWMEARLTDGSAERPRPVRGTERGKAATRTKRRA